MKLFDLLKSIGGAALASTPLGAAAIPVINSFLDDDKKLPENATGQDALNTIDSLPPEAKQALALAKIDLAKTEELGRTSRYEAMCKADGQGTRAKIVLEAMRTLTVITVLFIIAIGWVYIEHGAAHAFSSEMATVFLTISGTYAYVVRAYMGDLRTETESRHAVEDNKPRLAKGLAGLVQAIKK